jgi:hypothetical protein
MNTVGDKQKKVIAKIEALRKLAAAGDMKAKAELDRVTKIVSQVVAAQRAQNAAAEAAAVQQAQMLAQAMADDEVVAAEEAVFGGEDRLDIADRIAASAYHMDSLAQKVVQRGEEWHRLNQQSPFIRTNPVSVLNGILGNQIILESGQQGDVANWEGDDAETGPVTVVLGPSNQTLTFGDNFANPNTISPVRAYAIVHFGTKGFSTTVEVDVGSGCQFTVNASAVRVTIVMPKALNGYSANRIPVTGMLSFRAPLRTTPITRTIYWDDPIPLGPNAKIIVPPFAKKLTVITKWTTPYEFTVYDTAGNPTYAWNVIRAASTEFPTVILPGDAAFVEVGAVESHIIQNLKFVFELAVG